MDKKKLKRNLIYFGVGAGIGAITGLYIRVRVAEINIDQNRRTIDAILDTLQDQEIIGKVIRHK